MAASTFDELEALRELSDVGMPTEHAYAIAGELRKVAAIRRTGSPNGAATARCSTADRIATAVPVALLSFAAGVIVAGTLT